MLSVLEKHPYRQSPGTIKGFEVPENSFGGDLGIYAVQLDSRKSISLFTLIKRHKASKNLKILISRKADRNRPPQP
jgi:hypothetical protein